jgi:serine/threonine protein phosphatase PrpC
MEYEIGQANRLGNRSSNQDRFAVFETERDVLLVLADGMGGQAGGEAAAEIVVETARLCYEQARRPVSDPGALFRQMVAAAHQAVLDYGRSHTPRITPGTTGVFCLIQDNRASWAHVGDSRLYLFRNGLPLYRTEDHSYVETLYRRGMISRREQESHPMRNHITQCIGCQGQSPEVAVSKATTLHRDDIVLLCSDGLWGPLDDAHMGALLRDDSLEAVMDRMAEQAEQASYPSSDNISVIALRWRSAKKADKGGRPVRQRPREPRPPVEDKDKLQSAIDRIEQAIEEYRGEMKG